MTRIVSQILSKLTRKASEEHRLSIHQEHELLMRLERAGLTAKDAQRVIESKGNVVAQEILYVLRNGVYHPTKSQKAAKEIMGNNFFGIEDAIEHFDLRPDKDQIAELDDVPFSEVTLQMCKNTHILVAVFPMSILQMFENKKLRHLLCLDNPGKDPWFKRERFAWNEGGVGWYLISKQSLENSLNKEWVEQLHMFGRENEPASVRVVTYAALGHFLKTGETMFAENMDRCAELDGSGRRITVGPFKEDGLRVQAWWDDSRAYFVGAASSRRQE